MAKKSNKQRWFVPLRGSYIPNNWKGWLTYVPFTVYLLVSFYYGYHNVDGRLKRIFFIVPNWVAAVAMITWVAKRTS